MLMCFPFTHDYQTDKIMDGIRYEICTGCLKVRATRVSEGEEESK